MNDRFLKACRREPTDRTPIWLMRQAGRYMPEYRALRERYSLIDLCKAPELSLQVTLQPLRLGVDAAILFADILLPLEPMGAPFELTPNEGPVVRAPVTSRSAVEALRVIEPEDGLGYVLDAVRLIKRELAGKLPLIGFAGGPFTLASYLIEGGRTTSFVKTKRLMYGDPDAWHLLLSKLAEVVRRYLIAQIDAGADAIQLFDSWVGQLSRDDYEAYVLPHVKRVLDGVSGRGVPVIHFGTGTFALLDLMAKAGGDVLGLDWRTPLAAGWDAVGCDRAVQGNLDPTVLFAPREVMERHARRVLDAAGGRPGHIFNLGHGVLPETPVESVQALVDVVHDYRPGAGEA